MHIKYVNLVIPAIIASLAVGCATAPMTMSEQDTSSLYGSKLTAVYYEPDPFLPMTNSKGAFAVLGVAAAVSEGKTLVKEHDIQDPALSIRSTLARDLSETYQISDINVVSESIPYEKDPERVAALASNEGIVLDVRTFGWGTMAYPFKTKYKVNYFAQARLINAKESRLISADRCVINEEYSETSPTYDELMENGAALLKQKLASATTECAKTFSDKMNIKRTAALPVRSSARK